MSIRIVLMMFLGALFAPIALAQSPAEEARRVLASFAHEPTVLEVQRAAAEYAEVAPEVYASWRGQTEWANLLPERVNGEIYYLDRDEKDVRTTQSTQSQAETVSLDDHVRYKAVVEWDFSRLLFNPDTLTASRERSRIIERREDLLTTVNKLYFARRQLQAETALKPIEDTKRLIRTELRLASLTADLDALTGGWFSKRLLKRTSKKERPGAIPAPRPAAAAR
ncbi:MAG: hypothetical protein CL940_04405 [Deltaproteobacteria bacterium]|nr:hypothetical protein [Deltaproteobacteria bacterium]